MVWNYWGVSQGGEMEKIPIGFIKPKKIMQNKWKEVYRLYNKNTPDCDGIIGDVVIIDDCEGKYKPEWFVDFFPRKSKLGICHSEMREILNFMEKKLIKKLKQERLK